MIRHSLNYVSYKQRRTVATDLKRIYTATTEAQTELALCEFKNKWDADYPVIAKSWRKNCSRITPFLDYPSEIRRIIYTTNAIESLNMSLRKVTKSRASFPHDEAVMKLFYLALRNISQNWSRQQVNHWTAALNGFSIMFDDRINNL